VYVGQQVDVYIERSSNPVGSQAETLSNSAHDQDPVGGRPEGKEQ
jgi:hypothetical protein